MRPNGEFEGLSVLSRNEYNYLLAADMESDDVVRYFNDGNLKIRTFPEILRRFSPCGTDKETEKLLIEQFGKFSGGKNDSDRKKIQNWFRGREPGGKETLIKICFALRLNEDEAQRFMKYTQESGFHLRNPGDAAFLYCLRARKSYAEAAAFVKEFPMPQSGEENGGNGESAAIYTKIVAAAMQDVSSDQDFRKFYEENLRHFGALRNTAYEKFIFFLNALVEDDRYSIEEVGEYLRMGLPKGKETDAVLKTIRAYWPNETEIKTMRARSGDVSRKILLLLYIVTEGFVELGLGDEDVYESEEEMFQGLLKEHVVRINLMLDQCGFALLDPRNPFDWLVLYCLKRAEEKDKQENEKEPTPEETGSGFFAFPDRPDLPEQTEGMARQLQDVLAILFPQQPETSE